MTIDDKIRGGKLQYNINREAAKISALALCEIDEYECLRCEDILTSSQSQMIEQAKFIYSSLEKTFGKQTKVIEYQGRKQAEALNVLKRDVQQELAIEDAIAAVQINKEVKNEIERTY